MRMHEHLLSALQFPRQEGQQILRGSSYLCLNKVRPYD